MQVNFSNNILSKSTSKCLITASFSKNKSSFSHKNFSSAELKKVNDYLKRYKFNSEIGKLAHMTDLSKNIDDLFIIGKGVQKKYNERGFLRVVDSICNCIKNNKISECAIDFDSLILKESDVLNLVRLMSIRLNNIDYVYSQTLSKTKKESFKPKKITLILNNSNKLKTKLNSNYNIGKCIAEGVKIAKELGNLPANICTPTYLSTFAKSLSKNNSKLNVQVHTEKQMRAMGMNCLLSVSAGSKQEAKLITMKYLNGKKGDKPIILVGKGITFDTGGISIKPSNAMDEMKYDMCGAASVIGTMNALASMKAKTNVIGIVAASENMPGGMATKPGDVVKTMSGQTVEILNTDAEGRLVLCDALTYASKFKPEIVIDIATLTGAVLVALGKVASGLMSNNSSLAKEICKVSFESHDYVWELPMWEEFQSELDSNFADIANIGKRYAGSITAACFLSRFTENYKWAHLDIAGTAWNEGSNKGGTGRPVSLLTYFVLKKAKII